jgi:hypothetical protein
MLRPPYSAKPRKVRLSKEPPFLLILLLLILSCTQALGQGIAKFKADTVSLSRFEYTKKITNNGSDCTCSITNSSLANLATLVVTGAPDSMKVNSMVLFNGIHTLPPGQQMIVAGNFMGKQVTVMNLSLLNVHITVMLFCPSD